MRTIKQQTILRIRPNQLPTICLWLQAPGDGACIRAESMPLHTWHGDTVVIALVATMYVVMKVSKFSGMEGAHIPGFRGICWTPTWGVEIVNSGTNCGEWVRDL